MTTMIVLAMHGMPPTDFPKPETAELFGLHARLQHAGERERAALEPRYALLDAKMRTWPRTAQNDPFHAGSQELAAHLSRASGLEVFVGFNEFCAPGLDDVFAQVKARGADHVVVVTPMMTRGGEHSEIDIPNAIRRAQAQYPATVFDYVWPFPADQVAKFLSAQIALGVEPLAEPLRKSSSHYSLAEEG